MQNRRQYERFSFYEPVGYQRREEMPLSGATAEDISLMGLKMSVNEFIPLNAVLELQIHLPGQVRVIPARGTVVWVREIPHRDDGWEIGLQLIAGQPSIASLRDYINLAGLSPFRNN